MRKWSRKWEKGRTNLKVRQKTSVRRLGKRERKYAEDNLTPFVCEIFIRDYYSRGGKGNQICKHILNTHKHYIYMKAEH